MHPLRVQAVYQDTGVPAYRGNPFIEALPPPQETANQTKSLKKQEPLIRLLIYSSQKLSAHIQSLALVMSSFNHFNSHKLLPEKASLMIRGAMSVEILVQATYKNICKMDMSVFKRRTHCL